MFWDHVSFPRGLQIKFLKNKGLFFLSFCRGLNNSGSQKYYNTIKPNQTWHVSFFRLIIISSPLVFILCELI